jgi:bifunctional N-acetylglucosamine-1-phosphate-uridyltransferase/glucosamine-1-phosphate-acetyltransferase GlmU-like protein
VVAVLGHGADTVHALVDARYGAGAVGVALQTEQRGTGHAVHAPSASMAGERTTDRGHPVRRCAAAPERVAALIAACAESRAGMALLSTAPTCRSPTARLIRDEAGAWSASSTRRRHRGRRAIGEMNAGFAVRLRHLRAGLGQLRDDNAKRDCT